MAAVEEVSASYETTARKQRRKEGLGRKGEEGEEGR
jgi:hypothetical protein